MAAPADTKTLQKTQVGEQVAIPRESERFEWGGMIRREPQFDMGPIVRPMWPIMAAMGVMLVGGAIGVGIWQATLDDPVEIAEVSAWRPGLSFLGVGSLLSAITMVLAVILSELRDGGASVQRSLGRDALMLKRPWTAYVFPTLMMMGLMTLIAALGVGIYQATEVADDPDTAADIGAWLQPTQFAGVLMIFTAIVFALATIVRALRFQADRITEIAAEPDPTAAGRQEADDGAE